MVKTSEELALMRISGRLLASVFEMLDEQHLAGLSTMQVNDLVERFITIDLGARPASKGQYGFAYVLNCSINHVVCHGVPDANEIIRDGDIINLDITLEKNGFIADSSKTISSATRRRPHGASSRSRRKQCGRASARSGPARISAISAPRSSATRKRTAIRSCATIAGTGSAARCTRSRRS
jgi:methionine aminopeptidase